jgi:hypothetical protein
MDVDTTATVPFTAVSAEKTTVGKVMPRRLSRGAEGSVKTMDWLRAPEMTDVHVPSELVTCTESTRRL